MVIKPLFLNVLPSKSKKDKLKKKVFAKKYSFQRNAITRGVKILFCIDFC